MWSAAIPSGSVQFDLDDEEATLNVKNALVFDGFTVPNSLNTFHPIGHVNAVMNSLRMKWSGTKNKRSVNDCADAFRGDFFENTATIAGNGHHAAGAGQNVPPHAGAERLPLRFRSGEHQHQPLRPDRSRA